MGHLPGFGRMLAPNIAQAAEASVVVVTGSVSGSDYRIMMSAGEAGTRGCGQNPVRPRHAAPPDRSCEPKWAAFWLWLVREMRHRVFDASRLVIFRRRPLRRRDRQ